MPPDCFTKEPVFICSEDSRHREALGQVSYHVEQQAHALAVS